VYIVRADVCESEYVGNPKNKKQQKNKFFFLDDIAEHFGRSFLIIGRP